MKGPNLVTLALLIGSLAAVEGDSGPPLSPAAVSALRKYDTAAEKAHKDYARAMVAVEKQLLADLKGALASAMASKDLEEAKRIDRQIASASARLAESQSGEAALSFQGVWDISYANGAHSQWTLSANGDVQWEERHMRSILRNGLIKWNDNAVERVTPAGNRLFIEYFWPDQYPKGTPVLGVGVRK